MKTYQSRKYCAQVECLETREVLSTLHAAAHARGNGLSLQGRGIVQILTERSSPSGELEAFDAVQGAAKGLGSYSGNIDITLSSNMRDVSGIGDFITSAGRLNFTLSGKYTGPK